MDYGPPPSDSPQVPVTHYPDDYDPALNGVGGWLVLVIIGRILTAIMGIKDIVDMNALLGIVSSLDSLIYFSIIFDVAVYIILSGVILYFMFAHKIIFRLLFVIQVAAVLFYTVLINIMLSGMGYETTYAGLLQTIAVGAIWIAYLYKSKRVNNTYIYPYQNFEEGQGL